METPQDAKREAIPSASLVASDPAPILAAAEITHGIADPTLKPPPVDAVLTHEYVLNALQHVQNVEARLLDLEAKLENVGGTWLSDMKAWFQRHTGM